MGMKVSSITAEQFAVRIVARWDDPRTPAADNLEIELEDSTRLEIRMIPGDEIEDYKRANDLNKAQYLESIFNRILGPCNLTAAVEVANFEFKKLDAHGLAVQKIDGTQKIKWTLRVLEAGKAVVNPAAAAGQPAAAPAAPAQPAAPVVDPAAPAVDPAAAVVVAAPAPVVKQGWFDWVKSGISSMWNSVTAFFTAVYKVVFCRVNA